MKEESFRKVSKFSALAVAQLTLGKGIHCRVKFNVICIARLMACG